MLGRVGFFWNLGVDFLEFPPHLPYSFFGKVSKKLDVRECRIFWNLGVDFLEFPLYLPYSFFGA